MHYGNPDKKEKGAENQFKEIDENFANLEREVGIQIHGFPNRLNPKRTIPCLPCNHHGKHKRCSQK